MNWLKKLPGYQRTPYGFELQLLRKLPQLTVAGTLIPMLAALIARFYFDRGSVADIARQVQTFDFVMMGLVVFVWVVILTVAIGCVIVWLMKGPAYVADGYEVSHSDKPKV
ncbi:MAG: hypothetical protein GW848_11290 [Rhodoferax sp.]|nr:hypothetical protein [Rhodoferax sp.]NCP55550.1 hypothetical protein [Rhodoferax sp.]OIP18478.1 MAG: hypothetical protein AUK51_04395 [Comamonadaceae bacterium CG2_30_59_20]PIY23365.1 MAG: hypothetical protein COZ10_09405 [Comamonadaceae bacterium CG_4_10_14_3_um_filter_60_75]PJC12188.1 MAG: hypothetical protein CO066_11630 [Comamonadaceae bacterium CG_4_9_14_0_8_um_filter_60_18]